MKVNIPSAGVRSWRITLCLALALLLLTSVHFLSLANAEDDGISSLLSQASTEETNAALYAKVAKTAQIRVIVILNSELVGAQQGETDSIAAAQESFLDEFLTAHTLENQAVTRFETIPGFALNVDEAGLLALTTDPSVSHIQEDTADPPTLYDSIPLIDANDAWALGYRGQGQVVAILDTGVTKTHPFLTGKVVSEACYSTNSGTTVFSLCPGGVTSSTAVGSGLDCDPSVAAGCGHGTHVAGIAAGTNGASTGGTIHGVARDAQIIAIKVFSRFTSSADCYPGSAPCALSYTSDQIRGLERVYALRNSYSIAAINMSLGGGQYTSYCDSDSRKPIIDNLRNAGIATVIASGNSGYTGAVGAPGCISSAICVGATTKSDTVADYSNHATIVDLLAPGSSICSSIFNQTSQCGTGYGFKSGTSMATPHVTGAWAVMKSKNGIATVSTIENALESTGVSISHEGITKPRIDLDNAVRVISVGPQRGWNYDHCYYTWTYVGSPYTWCYTYAARTWLTFGDRELGRMMNDSAAKWRWIVFNVSSTYPFNVDYSYFLSY